MLPLGAWGGEKPLLKVLPEVYNYWRNAMIVKNPQAWQQITASHRVQEIKNRLLSQKASWPEAVFHIPALPPSLKGLELVSAHSKGATAKLVYFGKVDFGVGGNPTDNLLVISFLYERGGWKYDNAEFINLKSLPKVRKDLQNGKRDYVQGVDFLPDGKIPPIPSAVPPVHTIAKVYTFCPGREVKVRINGISSHRFQDTQDAEIILGGARNGINDLSFEIANLPDYHGKAPLTLRVYLFSEVYGVKPIKVFEYQIKEGETPKHSGKGRFLLNEKVKRALSGQKSSKRMTQGGLSVC